MGFTEPVLGLAEGKTRGFNPRFDLVLRRRAAPSRLVRRSPKGEGGRTGHGRERGQPPMVRDARYARSPPWGRKVECVSQTHPRPEEARSAVSKDGRRARAVPVAMVRDARWRALLTMRGSS